MTNAKKERKSSKELGKNKSKTIKTIVEDMPAIPKKPVVTQQQPEVTVVTPGEGMTETERLYRAYSFFGIEKIKSTINNSGLDYLMIAVNAVERNIHIYANSEDQNEKNRLSQEINKALVDISMHLGNQRT
eukprot:Pgem_evm1s13616